jgi:hypothetical protein
MKVVPEELCTTAEACVGLATDLVVTVTDNAADLAVGSRDAGNTQGGYDATTAVAPATEAALTAIETLGEVFAVDADALMLCAFAYSGTDEQSATRFEDRRDDVPHTAEPPLPDPRAKGGWPNHPVEPVQPPTPVPGPSPTPPSERAS